MKEMHKHDPRKPYTRKAWESFILLIIEGKTASDAYREVYPRSRKWKPKALWQRSSDLHRKVKGRIEHLRGRETDRKILSIQRRKELLSQTAQETLESKLSDYVVKGADGEAKIKYSKESPRPGAVAELTTSTRTDERTGVETMTTRIKLHGRGDGIAAIQELNKMDGVYKQASIELPVGNGVLIVYNPPKD